MSQQSPVQLDDETLVAWMRELNQKHFEGLLLRIPVFFEAQEDRIAGRFVFHDGACRIEVNKNLRDDPVEARRTLLHEMIHAYIHRRGGPSSHRRNSAHGADFAVEVKRLIEAGEDVQSELERADCASTDEEALKTAALVCIERQAGRVMINGKRNKRGLWMPAADEWRECCRQVSAGTKRFPMGLKKHCVSATHVSRLFGVDAPSLRRRVEALKAERAISKPQSTSAAFACETRMQQYSPTPP